MCIYYLDATRGTARSLLLSLGRRGTVYNNNDNNNKNNNNNNRLRKSYYCGRWGGDKREERNTTYQRFVRKICACTLPTTLDTPPLFRLPLRNV